MREEALLAQVRVLTEKHEALAAATGQNFNLFKILGRETDEVHTHSAILAELLNPAGSHGQGPLFTRLFAEHFKLDLPAEGIDFAQVWAERTVDKESRIDILMTLGDDACVVVENKIHAGDQPGQIKRYHEYAATWSKHKVIYLTLHGDAPSDESLGELPQNQRDKIECRSYESDVLAWLDACIKEVALVPQIREILAHYRALLRKLTGKSTGELVMDLKKLLENKQGDAYNFELMPIIADAMTDLSIEKEWKFWQTLKDGLMRTEGGHWRLEPVDPAEFTPKPVKEVDEEIIRRAYGRGKHKWHYGLTFRVKSHTHPQQYRAESTETLLRIECDGGSVYFGFIVVQKTSEGLRRRLRSEEERVFEDWGKRLTDLQDGWFTNHDQWPAWGYPYEMVSLQKSSGWLVPETLGYLMNMEKEAKAVDPLVSSIHDTIDLLEEQEGSLK